MTETIVLAFILAKLKGYKLKPALKCWVLYPIIICEVLFIFFEINIYRGNYEFVKFAIIYKSLYMLLFLIPIFKYKEYVTGFIGSIFIFIGTALNKYVMGINENKMPVFPSLSYLTGYIKPDCFDKINDIHVLGNSQTNVKFLTDVIDTGYSILSIGDIFIRIFVFMVIYSTIKQINLKLHFNNDKTLKYKRIFFYKNS